MLKTRKTGRDWARTALEVGLLILTPKAQAEIKDRADDWKDRAEDLRSRVGRKAEKLHDSISDKYDDASDRISNAAAALRGESRWPRRMVSFIAGIGVGSGLAILFAPASGKETREAILDTAASKMRRPVAG